MRKTKMRLLVKLFIVVIVLTVITALVGWWYWNDQLQPVNSSNTQKQAFVIQKKEPTSQVALRLQQAGLIKSGFVFRAYLKLSNKAGQIQAGDFKLSPSMSIEEVINQLSFGMVDKWLTLIEGWRVEEEATEIEKQLGIKKDDFIKQADEGYMFPDTYLFNKDVSAPDIVARLRSEFDKKYTSEIRSQIKQKGLTEEQGVILASIVEREARSDEVRTQVASILLRRLNEDIGLNADATLQYALGYQSSDKTWWKKSLTTQDKKIESPYNSYKYKGLPPTPICNPSLSSLTAVANADSNTPYLYYLHDSQGQTYYAKTLEEHNRNVADHL